MNTWKKSLPTRNLHCGLALTLILGTLYITAPSAAREVPFPTKHTVDASFGGAVDVYAADVDGDGDLDVLGAAYAASDIAWWENVDLTGPGTGDGSAWTEHTVDGEFDGASSVHAADVDGDGDLDVLGAASTAGDITWWENVDLTGPGTGDGSAWTEHTVDGEFDGVRSVYTADVDGDGDTDVLGEAYTEGIAWWENVDLTGPGTGDGSDWTEHSVDTAFLSYDVHAADVDGDGDPDVLGASYTEGIAWWENTAGDGSAWATEHNVDPAFDGAFDVYAADVDGDGDLDILGAASVANDIAWWENTAGDGSTWAEHTVDGEFDGVRSVYAADVDGDGDLDVLGAAHDANDIAWWENVDLAGPGTGDGSAWTKHTVDAVFNGAWSVYAADVDGDGDLDVLGAAYAASDIAWWENETIHRSAYYPAAGEVAVDATFDGAFGARAADIDGDGDLDALGAASAADDIAWFENTASDGSAWTEHTVDGEFDGAFSVCAADVDGDGDLDIVGAANTADDIAWWENVDLAGPGTGDGSAWTKHTVDWVFNGAIRVYAADIDDDGDLDILGAAYDANDIAWWENTAGDGSAWTKHAVDTAFNDVYDVYAADVDGDGDLDVLGAATGVVDDIAWWENTTGDGSAWTKHAVDTAFDGASGVYAADVDGDGDLDVLGAANVADDIAWWENIAGDGSAWTEHTVDAAFGGAYDVHAADVDGDGDLDVLGAAVTADDIAWWENTAGDGSAWTEHAVDADFDGANSVYAADVDGDGDLDALGAANVADDIAWWENQGGQFALATTDTAPASMKTGTMDDILAIEVIHRGRSGDSDLELVTLELLFRGCYGSLCIAGNLTSAQANELFDDLRVYKDTGSGVFESGTDTLVTTVAPLALTDGVQTVTFSDGDANVQVAHGTPQTYFVVVNRVNSAPGSPTVDRFTITHITQASSTAEDRSHDIGLTLEYIANAASSQVIAAELLPVNSSNDPGNGACNASECTLREAVTIATTGDTVTFAPTLAGVTITLGSEITLTKDLTIDGSSLSSHVKVSGGDSVRVFAIPEGVTIVINHLDIKNGRVISGYGGGIDVFSSTLTISNTTLSGNSASTGGAINIDHATLFISDSSFVGNSADVYGGAINNHYGAVTLLGSTISGNTASTGGGIFNNTGYAAITNSTVFGNNGTVVAGGLLNYGDPGLEGLMKIKNSTISGNTSPFGGGIVNGETGTLHLLNSIVADSLGDVDCVNAGTLATNINNLIEDGTCSPAVTGDPQLDPLADNGGPTHTMALGDGSPAVDTGDDATCEPTDQRGISRPQGVHCDIGAYEAELYSVHLPLIMR
jgi:hypothetical protein